MATRTGFFKSTSPLSEMTQMKSVVTQKCWSCNKELPEVARGKGIECCGLVHWPSRRSGESDIFRVEEKRILLYRMAPLICIAIAMWSIWFIANDGTTERNAWKFAIATGFFLYAFSVISYVVHEIHRGRKVKKQLPRCNNNFAKWLLVSTSITTVLIYAMLSGWLSSSSNCVETRYYSCP